MRTSTSGNGNGTFSEFGKSSVVAALGLGGFLLAATGVIVTSPGLAMAGWFLLLMGVGLYGRWFTRADPGPHGYRYGVKRQ